MKYSYTWYLLIILLITINTTDIFSQTKESSSFTKGDIVTSFNLGYTGAERDVYSIEFEQSFKRLSLNLQAFIFITENFGLGFDIGKQNLERKYVYDDFGEVVTSYRDHNFLIYSIYAGYYTPLALFGGNTIGYIEGGVLRFQDEEWFFKGDYYGYKLSTGILVPINTHTFLNVKLQQFSYQYETRYGNNNIKWPINFMLNVGVSVKL